MGDDGGDELPSAAPMLLLFARVNRKEKAGGPPLVPTGVFAAGYLLAWGAFSAVETGLQWGLEGSHARYLRAIVSERSPQCHPAHQVPQIRA